MKPSPLPQRPRLAAWLLGLMLMLVAPQTAGAADLDQLQADLEALKAGQAEIRAEIGQLRDLLQRLVRGRGEAAFEPTEVSVAGSAYLGEADAPVTLVEFSDYQCPFCLRHSQTVMRQLREGPVVEGTLRYVMKEYPIESIHPLARKASEAALCAGDAEAYWAMHDLILEHPRRLRPRDFKQHAEALGLDQDDFADCLDSGTKGTQIDRDLALGESLGIRGTPSFLVAVTNPNDPDQVMAVQIIRGAQPAAVFERAIDQALEVSKRL